MTKDALEQYCEVIAALTRSAPPIELVAIYLQYKLSDS